MRPELLIGLLVLSMMGMAAAVQAEDSFARLRNAMAMADFAEANQQCGTGPAGAESRDGVVCSGRSAEAIVHPDFDSLPLKSRVDLCTIIGQIGRVICDGAADNRASNVRANILIIGQRTGR
jgi:hypothetical protein